MMWWYAISAALKGVRSKNKLILRLMEAMVYPNPAAYHDLLIRFSALNHTTYSEVCILYISYMLKNLTIQFERSFSLIRVFI